MIPKRGRSEKVERRGGGDQEVSLRVRRQHQKEVENMIFFLSGPLPSIWREVERWLTPVTGHFAPAAGERVVNEGEGIFWVVGGVWGTREVRDVLPFRMFQEEGFLLFT